jgi:transposase
MTRTSASEWAERIAEWRASGKSAAAFCEMREYSAKSLQWWSSQLKRRGQLAASSEAQVKLARVMRDRRDTRSSAQSIVVLVGEARVEVPAGADRATLDLVFGVLREAQAGMRR